MGNIPLAVAPTVKTPGLALVVNLAAGAASPGSAPKKALVMAVKDSSGTITADTEIKESVAGEEEAATFLGGGTPGHLAFKRIFEEHGIAQVDLVSPADPAGVAAAQTVVFGAGPVTNDVTVRVFIAGRRTEFLWKTGETVTQAGDKFEGVVNALDLDLPLTAANAVGTVTLTFKHTGIIGNNVRLRLETENLTGSSGTVVLTAATLAAGAGEPDFSNAISTIVGKEYDLILEVVSNEDAQDGTGTSNPGRMKTDINLRETGFTAKLQQAVVGTTGALAALKVGTTALNHENSQYVFCLAGESLGCEFGGAELGARLRDESLDPAVNRINKPYVAQLFGAADLSADEPTDVEVEDALNSGITIVTYEADGDERPSRPITTFHLDASGNPDFRVLDTSIVTGTYAVAKDLRISLPLEFEGAKLSADIEPGADEPPKGVIQIKDIKAFIVARIRFWISEGVVRQDKFNEALANGTFIVRVNTTDDSQCDIVLPVTIFPPLSKFSTVVQHRVA